MTTSAKDDDLAIAGGPPAAAGLQAPPWPPRDDVTARRLADIYWDGRWSFSLCGEEEALCREFAAAHDARYGIFMANGTVSLMCALAAHGIGPGDEVIVPAFTCTTSVFPVRHVGARAAFVDVDESTLCLDPAGAEAAITERTKAIIPVHLYGSMADMSAILAIAKRANLVVIEDCAHVPGGKWSGQGIGSLGHVGSFSFHQKKPLAAGEGGICITNDAEIADRIHRMMHIGYAAGNYAKGIRTAPPPGLICYNFGATEFQAAILREQLAAYEARAVRYREGAARLEVAIARIPGVRVQARGRLSSPQTYNKMLFLFDQEPLQDIPLGTLLRAIRAEGVPLEPTYGAVYRHPMFNLGKMDYVTPAGGCRVAEQLGERRGATLAHQWLGAEPAVIDAIVGAIAKVAAKADLLRDLALATEAAE